MSNQQSAASRKLHAAQKTETSRVGRSIQSQADVAMSPEATNRQVGLTGLSVLLQQSGPGMPKLQKSEESQKEAEKQVLKRISLQKNLQTNMDELKDLRTIKEAEQITAGFLSNIESFVSIQDDQERQQLPPQSIEFQNSPDMTQIDQSQFDAGKFTSGFDASFGSQFQKNEISKLAKSRRATFSVKKHLKNNDLSNLLKTGESKISNGQMSKIISQIEGEVKSIDRRRDHRTRYVESSQMQESTPTDNRGRPPAAPMKQTREASLIEGESQQVSLMSGRQVSPLSSALLKQSTQKQSFMISVDKIPLESLHAFQRSSIKELSKLDTDESQITLRNNIEEMNKLSKFNPQFHQTSQPNPNTDRLVNKGYKDNFQRNRPFPKELGYYRSRIKPQAKLRTSLQAKVSAQNFKKVRTKFFAEKSSGQASTMQTVVPYKLDQSSEDSADEYSSIENIVSKERLQSSQFLVSKVNESQFSHRHSIGLQSMRSSLPQIQTQQEIQILKRDSEKIDLATPSSPVDSVQPEAKLKSQYDSMDIPTFNQLLNNETGDTQFNHSSVQNIEVRPKIRVGLVPNLLGHPSKQARNKSIDILNASQTLKEPRVPYQQSPCRDGVEKSPIGSLDNRKLQNFIKKRQNKFINEQCSAFGMSLGLPNMDTNQKTSQLLPRLGNLNTSRRELNTERTKQSDTNQVQPQLVKSSVDHGVFQTDRQYLEVEPENLMRGLDNMRVYNEKMGRQKHILMRNLRNIKQNDHRSLQVTKNKPTPRQKLVKKLVQEQKAKYQKKLDEQQQKLLKNTDSGLLSRGMSLVSSGIHLNEPMSAIIPPLGKSLKLLSKFEKAQTICSNSPTRKYTIKPTMGSAISEQSLSDIDRPYLSLEENKKRINELVDQLMKMKRKQLGKPEFNEWLTDQLLREQRLLLEGTPSKEKQDLHQSLEDVIISAKTIQNKNILCVQSGSKTKKVIEQSNEQMKNFYELKQLAMEIKNKHVKQFKGNLEANLKEQLEKIRKQERFEALIASRPKDWLEVQLRDYYEKEAKPHLSPRIGHVEKDEDPLEQFMETLKTDHHKLNEDKSSDGYSQKIFSVEGSKLEDTFGYADNNQLNTESSIEYSDDYDSPIKSFDISKSQSQSIIVESVFNTGSESSFFTKECRQESEVAMLERAKENKRIVEEMDKQNCKDVQLHKDDLKTSLMRKKEEVKEQLGPIIAQMRQQLERAVEMLHSNQLIFSKRQTHEVLQKEQKRFTENYKKQEVSDDFIDRISYQCEFYGVAKTIGSALLMALKDEQEEVGAIAVLKEQQTMITSDIFQKLVDKKLPLVAYHLNSQISKALAKFLKINKQCIVSLVLDSNSLQDESFAIILESLENQCLKSLHYFNNSFGQHSLTQLKKLFARKAPQSLTELQIGCKMPKSIIRDLLEALKESKELRRLALVGLQSFAEDSLIVSLCQFLSLNEKKLVELDLSWNYFKMSQMEQILKVLSKSQELQSLNVRFNTICRSDNITQLISQVKTLSVLDIAYCHINESQLVEVLSILDQSNIQVIELTGNDKIPKDHPLSTKSNQKNTPAKISQCNEFVKIFQKREASHWNPIHKQAQEMNRSLYLRQLQNQEFENTFNNRKISNLQETLIFQRVLWHEEIAINNRWEKIQEIDRPLNSRQDWQRGKHIYTIILWSEYFGIQKQHDEDILQQLDTLLELPDPNDLKEKQIQLILQRPVIPKLLKRRQFKFPSDQERRLEAEDEYEEPPMFAGSFNDWQYTPMCKVEDFCFTVDKKSKHPLDYMMQNNLCEDVESVEDLQDNEIAIYKTHAEQKFKDYKRGWLSSLLKNIRYQEPLMLNLQEHQNYPNIKIKLNVKTQMFSGNKIRETQGQKEEANPSQFNRPKTQKPLKQKLAQLWVGVTFAKPGKHSYIVRFNKSVEDEQSSGGDSILEDYSDEIDCQKEVVSYSLHNCVVPHRQEPVAFGDQKQRQQKQAIFDQANSMFKDWVADDEYTLSSCLKDDSRNWKIQQLLRVRKHQDDCMLVFKKNFRAIKKIFTIYASRSLEYPGIDWPRYMEFCRDSQMKQGSSNITQQVLRTAYIDTKFDSSSSTNELKPALMRCEFMEILLRLALTKYTDTEKTKNPAQALQRLLDEHVLSLENLDDWQEFRDEVLWTQEVSDIFEANENSLRQIFRDYIMRRLDDKKLPVYVNLGDFRNKIALEDAIEFVIKDLHCGISYHEALYRYGMSKMTLTRENDNADEKIFLHGRAMLCNHEYLFMSFVEFLEYIGRIAALIYDKNKHYYGHGKQEMELPFCLKLSIVLKEIFQKFNQEYSEPLKETSQAQSHEEPLNQATQPLKEDQKSMLCSKTTN